MDTTGLLAKRVQKTAPGTRLDCIATATFVRCSAAKRFGILPAGTGRARMPIQMEVFHPDRLVLGVARGDVGMAEYGKFLAEIIQAGLIHYRKIIDVTDASSSTMGPEAFLAFDGSLKASGNDRRGPLAIVIDRDRAGRAHAFKATSQGRPVEVFHSIHDAKRWLASQPVKE